jgi:DUF4097 and DUF4098 domain-containing protein YvlB
VEKVPLDSVNITALLTSQREDRLSGAQVIAARSADGTLSIDVRWPEGLPAAGEACELRVTLPDANGVRCESENGSISVTGLEGEADLRCGNGSIEVRQHAGPVRAASQSGGVKLSGTLGSVDALTSQGSIEVRGACESVLATTTRGEIDIRFAKEGRGPVSAKTEHGSIVLSFGSKYSGDLRMTTANGELTCRTPEGATLVEEATGLKRLQIGEVSERSSLETMNGNIRVWWEDG